MQSYTSEQLRNVVFMGHGGAGKTTLAEAMLFVSGALSRMGNVDAGNTAGDFDPQEHAHRYSIGTSILPVEWAGARINVIDTPGTPDFLGEAACGAAAAEAMLIAVDASAGVQGGAEAAWTLAEAGSLPRVIAVTRLDRDHADFDRTLAALRETFGKQVVPLAIPIGAAQGFEGIAGLIRGRAYLGAEGAESDPPAALTDAIAAARDLLIEAVAESDDTLLEQYLDGQTIDGEALATALAAGLRAGSIVPVLPVSATTQVGVRYLLDRLVQLLPSPVGREHALEQGSVTTAVDGPLVVHVFKTTADPFVGRLTFLKVLSGTLSADAHPWNARRGAPERLGHLYLARGKEQIEAPRLVAGDIGVAAKLAVTLTGDTLVASDAATACVPALPLPTPTYRTAIHPHSKDDIDKLSTALTRLCEQDPTIRVARDPDTAELVMFTLGDAQAAVAAARLQANFGVAVDVAEPRVPYRETVAGTTRAEYRHKKQTGGHGQYGHVVIEVSPRPRGDGFLFEQKVVGGTVPRQFIPAVEKGVTEALPAGPLAHSPLVDLQVTLVDGSAHAVDSSEMAFKLAASQALKQAVLDAHPVLLEPMMRLHIRVPADHVGDVMSDLSGRRGQAHGVDPQGAYSVIDAHAPLAEVQRYAVDLRALTQGRGAFTMEFDHYAEAPAPVQQQVVQQLHTPLAS